MLKKDHFSRLRQQLEGVGETFSRSAARSSRRLRKTSSRVRLHINERAGLVMLLMTMILLVGLAGVLLHRNRLHTNQRVTAQQIFHQGSAIGEKLSSPVLSGFEQKLNMSLLERQLEQILLKDSLTGRDSLWLRQVDQYLNSKTRSYGKDPNPTSPQAGRK